MRFKLLALLLLTVACSAKDGHDGRDGASIGFVTSEAGRDYCETGGTSITLWTDANFNGLYDNGEPNYVQRVVCNGRDGMNGQDGMNGRHGQDGMNGRDGMNGQGCTIERIGDYESRVVCGDQWSVIYDGHDGQDGMNGRDGHDGRDGRDGYGCTLEEHPEGVALVCGDYVEVIRHGRDGEDGDDGEDGHDGRDGMNGRDGIGCEIEQIETGDFRVTCGNTVQIIRNGRDGADGQDGRDGENCSVREDADHSIVIECPDSSVTIPPEREIVICQQDNRTGRYQTRSLPVSQFIAEVYGRYNYRVGACH